ncbi:MAG: glycosyltransferase 87 family protein [Pseudomonadota bacterium]
MGIAAGVHAIGLIEAVQIGYYGQDFRSLWHAGVRIWLGENPWLLSERLGTFIAYPPHAVPLLAPFGLLDWDGARLANTVISAFCLASLVVLAHRWFAFSPGREGLSDPKTQGDWRLLLPIALVALDTFSGLVLAIGQTSLVTGAASLWA